MADGSGLHKPLKTRNFTVHLIGQVPQQTHAVLYQLRANKWQTNRAGLLECKDSWSIPSTDSTYITLLLQFSFKMLHF